MKYGTFEVEVRKHLIAINKGNQIDKLSTLSAQFQKALGRKEDDTVEQDLAPDYQENSEKKFVEFMRAKNLKESTIRGNLSFIRTNFFGLYQNSFSVMAILSARPFGQALQDLRSLRGLTRKALCSKLSSEYELQLSVQALTQFETSKAFPRTITLISKIEKALNTPADSLKSKIPAIELATVDFESEKSHSEDLKRHWNFTFKPDPKSPTLIEEDIEHLLWLKSTNHNELGDHDLVRGDRSVLRSATAIENTRGKYYRYIGYLLMPVIGSHPLCSGKGYSREKLRLLDLLKSSNITGYLNFLKLRSRHQGNEEKTPKWFIEIYKCLRDITAEHGVIIQTRSRYKTHTGFLSEFLHSQEAWATKIKKIYDNIGNDMKAFKTAHCSNEEADLSDIEKIVKIDRPIRALINVVMGMTSDLNIYESLGPAFEQDFHYLNLYRAFFSFEAVIPLRITQINEKVLLTDLIVDESSEHGSPQHIFLRKMDFKNWFSPAVVEGNYELIFTASQDLKIDVPKMLGEYIKKSRPFFIKKAQKRISELKSKAEELRLEGEYQKAEALLVEADSIPNRLFPITLTDHRHYMYSFTYSKMGIGWTFHSNRHIVATDIVKFFFANGHNGYFFAASALFDTLETVQSTYAQFGPDDIHKLKNQIQKEIAQKSMPRIERKGFEKGITNELELTRAINDYVDREKSILLSMTDNELRDTFADEGIYRRVKARLNASMRTSSSG